MLAQSYAAWYSSAKIAATVASGDNALPDDSLG